MTKDEVIELAKQAGFADGVVEIVGLYGFMKFANLVASAARNMTFTQAHWTDYEESIVAVEREECAKVCENLAMQQERDVRDECAEAIRARGNT
jgi:hypothetical protein